MAEYIEREEVLNNRPEGRNPTQIGKEEYNKGWNDCRHAFFECIDNATAADVAPVRHGRWDENNRCTNCGGHAPYYAMTLACYRSPYCFECGAKMDLEEAP